MKNVFRTVLTYPKAGFEIGYHDHICAIGSCFAENMSGLLQSGRFSVDANPFGILYNPVSIAGALLLLFGKDSYPEENLVDHGGLWHSFMHHGRFTSTSREALLEKIDTELERARRSAKKCTKILLTLGSATVYQYRESGKIVANCHKIPNSIFVKRRLSVEECTESLIPVLQKIKKENPDIEIIVSVSPVRHLRDGFTENQLSKSTLLLCCEALQKQLPFVHYFPAYEMLMDDLRDYRFYNADMIHPGEMAIGYIWDQFRESFFSEETGKIYAEVWEIERLKAHRPHHPESSESAQLKNRIAEKTLELEARYPFLR